MVTYFPEINIAGEFSSALEMQPNLFDPASNPAYISPDSNVMIIGLGAANNRLGDERICLPMDIGFIALANYLAGGSITIIDLPSLNTLEGAVLDYGGARDLPRVAEYMQYLGSKVQLCPIFYVEVDLLDPNLQTILCQSVTEQHAKMPRSQAARLHKEFLFGVKAGNPRFAVIRDHTTILEWILNTPVYHGQCKQDEIAQLVTSILIRLLTQQGKLMSYYRNEHTDGMKASVGSYISALVKGDFGILHFHSIQDKYPIQGELAQEFNLERYPYDPIAIEKIPYLVPKYPCTSLIVAQREPRYHDIISAQQLPLL
ncbi:MAG: hypothetical protein ABIG95_01355 [Candidatus Woesearchaeota archaeon]